MWEKLIIVLVGVVGPAYAFVRQASRRSRMREQMRAHAQLASELEERNGEAATRLNGLITELTDELIKLERGALRHKFDPWTLFAAAFYFSPAAIALYLIWPVGRGWDLLVTVVAGLWAFVVLVAMWQTAWKPRAEES